MSDDAVASGDEVLGIGKYNLLLLFQGYGTWPRFPKIGDMRKVEKYSGYGIKTASLFNMHVFGEKCAVLDTYILRWLAGDTMFHDAPIDIRPPFYKDVPRQSISNWDVYRRWEDAFLSECYRRGMETLELDREIWLHSRIKTEKPKHEQKELKIWMNLNNQWLISSSTDSRRIRHT